jgi:hypothetical protein
MLPTDDRRRRRAFSKSRATNDLTNLEVTSKSRDTPIHRFDYFSVAGLMWL